MDDVPDTTHVPSSAAPAVDRSPPSADPVEPGAARDWLTIGLLVGVLLLLAICVVLMLIASDGGGVGG